MNQWDHLGFSTNHGADFQPLPVWVLYNLGPLPKAGMETGLWPSIQVPFHWKWRATQIGHFLRFVSCCGSPTRAPFVLAVKVSLNAKGKAVSRFASHRTPRRYRAIQRH